MRHLSVRGIIPLIVAVACIWGCSKKEEAPEAAEAPPKPTFPTPDNPVPGFAGGRVPLFANAAPVPQLPSSTSPAVAAAATAADGGAGGEHAMDPSGTDAPPAQPATEAELFPLPEIRYGVRYHEGAELEILKWYAENLGQYGWTEIDLNEELQYVWAKQDGSQINIFVERHGDQWVFFFAEN